MKNPVCDFCLSGDVRWTFPCKTFVSPLTGDRSVTDWSACDPCMRLVESKQWVQLAERSVDLSPTFKDQPLLALVRGMIVQTVMQLHRVFQANRTGPVRPASHEDYVGFEINSAFCHVNGADDRPCGKPATHDLIDRAGVVVSPCCEPCGKEYVESTSAVRLVERRKS